MPIGDKRSHMPEEKSPGGVIIGLIVLVVAAIIIFVAIGGHLPG